MTPFATAADVDKEQFAFVYCRSSSILSPHGTFHVDDMNKFCVTSKACIHYFDRSTPI